MKLISKNDIQKLDYAQGSNSVDQTTGSIKVELNKNRYEIDFDLRKTQPVDFVPGDYMTQSHVMEYGQSTYEFEELTIWNSQIEMTTLEDSGMTEDDIIKIICDL